MTPAPDPFWIDSHCHLTASDFDADREAVLERAEAAGVGIAISIGSGYGIEDAEKAPALAARDPRVFASAGCHPHDAQHYDESARERIARCLTLPRVVAVGECGLDYWYENSPREAQRRAFADQLALAREHDLPVSIHVRDRAEDAYRELLEIWSTEGGGALSGVLHCYTHTAEFARRAIDAGLWISFSGILTFKQDRGLREVAAALPLDRLLVETDAPLLAPQGHRGRRNEPAHTALVGETLAAVRGLSVEEVAHATVANTRSVFRLPA